MGVTSCHPEVLAEGTLKSNNGNGKGEIYDTNFRFKTSVRNYWCGS